MLRHLNEILLPTLTPHTYISHPLLTISLLQHLFLFPTSSSAPCLTPLSLTSSPSPLPHRISTASFSKSYLHLSPPLPTTSSSLSSSSPSLHSFSTLSSALLQLIPISITTSPNHYHSSTSPTHPSPPSPPPPHPLPHLPTTNSDTPPTPLFTTLPYSESHSSGSKLSPLSRALFSLPHLAPYSNGNIYTWEILRQFKRGTGKWNKCSLISSFTSLNTDLLMHCFSCLRALLLLLSSSPCSHNSPLSSSSNDHQFLLSYLPPASWRFVNPSIHKPYYLCSHSQTQYPASNVRRIFLVSTFFFAWQKVSNHLK